MLRKTNKSLTGKSGRIQIRISADLKNSLETVCARRLESISEAVTRAIKNFIGFGMPRSHKNKISKLTDSKKDERLEIRIHPLLRKALMEFCKDNNIDTVSQAVIRAIKLYIKRDILF
jgi:metal-responsive CopG/Arc/MetJ family transcriptional regulator